MKKFSEPVVLIRPALPRDKADVFEFTKFIWDGHDYVGYVFPRWLEDPEGQLLVAEYAGHAVGTGKVTRLASGQWWLEGFRIDPKFQGLKFGSRLDAACNEWWDEHGDGTLRLMTSARRVQVHHLCEARGFVKMGEVFGYAAEPLAEPCDNFTSLKPDEADEAAQFFRRHAPGRLLNLGWRFAAPNAESLRGAAEEGLVWWWRGRRGLLLGWVDDEEDATRLVVGLEACADEDRLALLADVRRLAASRGDAVAGWMNAVDKPSARVLEAAGFVCDWEAAGFLYERSHP